MLNSEPFSPNVRFRPALISLGRLAGGYRLEGSPITNSLTQAG
jgi:hypothetical protein